MRKKAKFKRVTKSSSKKLKQQKMMNIIQKRIKGQAIKSIGRMPWHQEPKKDVTSCDKLRVAANRHRTADFRMGEPNKSETCYH